MGIFYLQCQISYSLQIGDFEMHMKRNLEVTIPPPPFESPQVAPPIPGEPMNSSTEVVALSSADKVNPFINISPEKTAKLAALEASGATDYVIVSCPVVCIYGQLLVKLSIRCFSRLIN